MPNVQLVFVTSAGRRRAAVVANQPASAAVRLGAVVFTLGRAGWALLGLGIATPDRERVLDRHHPDTLSDRVSHVS